jgi:hypothetical protein
MKPTDFAIALAEARRVLARSQPVPLTWLEGLHHLEDARDALGRPLDGGEAAAYREVAAALWSAAAAGCVAELELAVAGGARERNAVKRILDVELVAVERAATSAGMDWDAFVARHHDVIERARGLLTRGSGSR